MLSIAIQAGGLSRRMGQDKATLPFLGKPLIQWVYDRVQPAANEILIITNQPEKVRFLHCPVYRDALPSCGPLGGLYTALLNARYPYVGVLACDMPFASAELLVFEYQLLMNTELDVVIPGDESGLEPFHAIYRRETCLPLVGHALLAGETRVVDWLAHARVRHLMADEILPYDPHHLAFQNLNTPEQFQDAEELMMGSARINGQVMLQSRLEVMS